MRPSDRKEGVRERGREGKQRGTLLTLKLITIITTTTKTIYYTNNDANSNNNKKKRDLQKYIQCGN